MINPKKSFSNYLNKKKLHPVAISSTQDAERIFFLSEKGRCDITDHHALVSLKPFAIAVDGYMIPATENPVLQICDEQGMLGEIILRQGSSIELSNMKLKIFEAASISGSQFIPNTLWNAWMLQLKNFTNKKSKNFIVPAHELWKLFVYSQKPRPVFLISVAHENGFDAFPVDIIGKISDEKMLLSVRTTSAAIPHILSQRKLCASAVPYAKRNEVYSFGGHHPNGILPDVLREIKFIESEKMKIPVPSFAVSVMELMVEDIFKKGVHTTFLTSVIHHYTLSREMQLGHVPWFSKKYF